jgi:ribonuclease HII
MVIEQAAFYCSICDSSILIDKYVQGVRDSKKLSKNKIKELSRCANCFSAIVEKSSEVIDEINIRQACMQGMTEPACQVIDQLMAKGLISDVLIDGDFIPKEQGVPRLCYSIAPA